MDAAIHFDLDDTLVTDEGEGDVVAEAASTLSAEVDDADVADFRSLTVQYFQRNAGEPYRRAAEVWRDHRGLDLDPGAFAEELRERQVERAGLIEGTKGTLSALSGAFALGMITNGDGDVQRAKLRRHGLGEFFERIVVSGETPYMKPDDGIFEVAMDGLPAGAHVYVADRLAYDIVPARENGFRGVWVGDRESPAVDATVGSVAELSVERVERLLDGR